MSYYWFKTKEILQKARERSSNQKPAEDYSYKKEAIKEKSKKLIQKLARRRKRQEEEYPRRRYQQLIQYKKEALQNKLVLFLLSIRMSEKTLKFDNIRVNKKEFHKSKQPINLDLVNVDQIIMSDKFKHSDDCFKYFIGYKKDDIVKRLCIVLPQMTGYIEYFRNGGKDISFVMKDDDMLDKYNEI